MEQICTVDISIIDAFSVSLQPRALNPSVCLRFSPPLPLFSSSSTLSSLAREGRDVQFFSRRQERGRTVGEIREKIRERRDRDGRRREEKGGERGKIHFFKTRRQECDRFGAKISRKTSNFGDMLLHQQLYISLQLHRHNHRHSTHYTNSRKMATTVVNDADPADDLQLLLAEQRAELTAAQSLESDLDFAFRLQFEEAISAS
ncbi:hypothetical protein LWI29_016598 [Acer saccharum]|uniref:Uncharacterized protein n=1 Tax=Acer saccharum TaxID=4024 RepID=A0AA39TF02_ACESA|nr:hypothetical protein LWI29_016598 [Acer saccharum]